MNFDLAIGVSGTELNSASQAVYSALYPGIFTGSQVVNYQGLSFNVQWDVKNAPVFDLSTQVDPSIHLNALKEKAMASNPQAIQSLDLTALAAAIPSFQVSFPLVNITLSGATSVTLPMTLTASCTVQITNNAVAFNVSQVTAPPLQDPVQNYLVQNIVLPQILKISQNLFSGITIPPLSVDGVNLSSPSVGIVNNAVIAAANLQQSGTPPPPDNSFAWPQQPFFALIGKNIVQQGMVGALASATSKFSDHGSGGNSWAGYNWSYSLALVNPAVDIQGTSINVGLSITGGASGGVEVVYVPLSLGLNAYAKPDPNVTLGISIVGNKVLLTTQNVNPFAVLVVPNSVPGWVLGWLVAAIVTGIVSSVTPLITLFLNGINVAGLDIPSFSIVISNKTLTLTPTSLQVSGVSGYLAVTGQISIQ